ncbi:cytidine deaminase [Fodinibius sediminis]|uniref:Cytidine deaminase, homotetrameric n=1 Tax=Fodinibius sediminis TaxID=1214077 RepID=A0A521CZL9_9BACT|nr:cytidine deaminase [Fodinibius sediminis]SMO64874.1 cytidine deaminase, homotetrameric [Fodinibius sediminis]
MDIRPVYEQSYVPYSRQPEVAVVQSAEGRTYIGKRVENISYPLSINAAQNALFCCLSEGDSPENLLVTDHGDRLLSFWEEEYGIQTGQLELENLSAVEPAQILIAGNYEPVDLLSSLLDRALVEQSNFPVAALLETNEGYICGVNIECSSWNMGLCAERVALAKALTYHQGELGDLHVLSRDGDFSSPCGACRQVISEHLSHRQVHLHHADRSQSIHFIDDLLPFSFHSPSLSNS